jgi:hypothetical protein
MRELLPNELIVNGRGETKRVFPLRQELTTPQENIIAFPDKKESHIDWRHNFDKLTGITETIDRAEIVQEEGVYRVKLDHPEIPYAIGFIFSDSHIGTYTTDHELVRNFLETTLSTPNSFLVDAGDTFDAGIWGGLSHEDIIPTYMQTFTVNDIARELGDKFAAAVIGNHPEWLFTEAGIKPEFLFAQQIKGPVFPGMGLLHIEAGKQKYDWAIAHDYWGMSKKNIFNVCVNLRQNEYPDADIFTVGHEHIWGYMKEKVDNKERLYIRPGTAKINDRYARIHGIAKRGQAMGLAVILGLEKREFNAYTIEDATDLMEVRKKLAEYEK